MDKSVKKTDFDLSFIRLDKRFDNLTRVRKYLYNVFKDLSDKKDKEELLKFTEFNDYINLPKIICQRIFAVFDQKNKKYLTCEEFVEGIIFLLTCKDLQVLEFLFSMCNFKRDELVSFQEIKFLLLQLDYPYKDFDSELGVLEFNCKIFQNLLTKLGFVNIVKNNRIILHLIKCIYDALPITSDSLNLLNIDKQFKTMGNSSTIANNFIKIQTEGENLEEEGTIRAMKIPNMKIKKMKHLISEEPLTLDTNENEKSQNEKIQKQESQLNSKTINSNISVLFNIGKTSKNVRMTKEETFYESAGQGYVYKLTTNGKLRRFFISIINRDMFYFNHTKDKFIGLHHLSKCYAMLGEKKQIDNRIFYTFLYCFKNKKREYLCDDLDECKTWVNCLKKVTNYRDINDFYEVTDYVIGKGHYGTVYMGQDFRTDSKVAIKVIDKFKMTQIGLKTFYEELEILKRCDHEYIANLIDYFETYEHLYYVLEYYPSGNLYSLFNRGELTVNEKLAKLIIFQLGKGVKYLSDRGIIHRDLKLDNILLDSFSQVKIVDFGLGIIVPPDEKVFEEYGTLTYVAPEVIQKKGYNKEIDVWSLGIILFFLLFGKLPFTDPSNDKNNIATKISKREVILPKHLLNSVNPLALDLLKRCLSEQSVRISIESFLAHSWFSN